MRAAVRDEQPSGRIEQEKHCCSICDAKKRCHVCGAQTLYACSDCRIDFGVSIYVCATIACRNAHEEKCSARLGAASVSSGAVPRELDCLVEELVGWWDLNREGSVNRTYDYIDKMTKKLRAALDAGAVPPDERTKLDDPVDAVYLSDLAHEHAALVTAGTETLEYALRTVAVLSYERRLSPHAPKEQPTACEDCKPEYGDCLNAGCYLKAQRTEQQRKARLDERRADDEYFRSGTRYPGQ